MISVRINMVIDRNDTYTWILNTVQWAVNNCPSFLCDMPLDTTNGVTAPILNTGSLEPYIVREPGNLHYTFTFEDDRDATKFLLRWAS